MRCVLRVGASVRAPIPSCAGERAYIHYGPAVCEPGALQLRSCTQSSVAPSGHDAKAVAAIVVFADPRLGRPIKDLESPVKDIEPH